MSQTAYLAPVLEAEQAKLHTAQEGVLFDDANAPGNDDLRELAVLEAAVPDALQTQPGSKKTAHSLSQPLNASSPSTLTLLGTISLWMLWQWNHSLPTVSRPSGRRSTPGS